MINKTSTGWGEEREGENKKRVKIFFLSTLFPKLIFQPSVLIVSLLFLNFSKGPVLPTEVL